jgi:hypothetical protein
MDGEISYSKLRWSRELVKEQVKKAQSDQYGVILEFITE